MKLRISIVLLLLIVSVANAQFIGPKITSLEKEFNFGKIVEGAIVEHDFVITNNGDAELSLIKVSSTCGCTVAKPEKEKLQPGETTKLKATFNSKGKHGEQKKYINIFTNDKDNPRYRIVIFASVISKSEIESTSETTPKLFISESMHDFGTVKEGSVLDFNLTIKNIGDSELLISDVKTSCGCTAALLSNNKLKSGDKGNVRIELDTSGMKGKKTRTLAIISNDPVNPRMVITLFVNVEPSD